MKYAEPVVVLAFATMVLAQLPGEHATGPAKSLYPLIEALVSENLTAFDELMAAGADPNVVDVVTPLYACQENVRNNRMRHRLLRRLLKAGARPDMETIDGSTTLMLAAYHGDVRSAQMLLDHGADPLKRNRGLGCGLEGCDAIDAAYKGHHDELAEMMKEYLGESAVRYGGRPPLKEEL